MFTLLPLFSIYIFQSTRIKPNISTGISALSHFTFIPYLAYHQHASGLVASQNFLHPPEHNVWVCSTLFPFFFYFLLVGRVTRYFWSSTGKQLVEHCSSTFQPSEKGMLLLLNCHWQESYHYTQYTLKSPLSSAIARYATVALLATCFLSIFSPDCHSFLDDVDCGPTHYLR